MWFSGSLGDWNDCWHNSPLSSVLRVKRKQQVKLAFFCFARHLCVLLAPRKYLFLREKNNLSTRKDFLFLLLQITHENNGFVGVNR